MCINGHPLYACSWGEHSRKQVFKCRDMFRKTHKKVTAQTAACSRGWNTGFTGGREMTLSV